MTGEPGPARSAPVLLAALALALTAVSYAPALSGAFVSDDAVLVAGNPAIRSMRAALGSFDRSFWFGLKGVQPYYRPVPILSYAIDHAVSGMRPAGYHLTNLALHAGCAFLAGLLLLGLSAPGGARGSGRLAGSLLATALVAAHPLHSETVAAIYGRPDLLAGFFALAFLNLAVRGYGAPAWIALALALLSKESAAGLPLLAPFAIAAGRSRGPGDRGRGILGPALVAAAVLGGYVALRVRAVGLTVDPGSYTILDNPLVGNQGSARWLTPVAVLGRYAALWIRPVSLCADRGFDTVPIADSVLDPYFLAGAVLLAAGAIAFLGLLRRRSVFALPAVAAILTWLPSSSLVVMSPVLMAERFAYLPSIFVCVLLGALWARLIGAPHRKGEPGVRSRYVAVALHAAAAVLLVLAVGRTRLHAEDFHDDLSLYRATAAACPRSAKAQYNLGNALSRARKDAEAIEAFRSSVAIAPWLAIAHNNMGSAYLNLGRYREAEGAYREAARISPMLISPHESLAGLLYQDGRLEESREEARIALSLNPNPAEADQLADLVRRIDARLRPGP